VQTILGFGVFSYAAPWRVAPIITQKPANVISTFPLADTLLKRAFLVNDFPRDIISAFLYQRLIFADASASGVCYV
jgi:hypothetical protein